MITYLYVAQSRQWRDGCFEGNKDRRVRFKVTDYLHDHWMKRLFLADVRCSVVPLAQEEDITSVYQEFLDVFPDSSYILTQMAIAQQNQRQVYAALQLFNKVFSSSETNHRFPWRTNISVCGPPRRRRVRESDSGHCSEEQSRVAQPRVLTSTLEKSSTSGPFSGANPGPLSPRSTGRVLKPPLREGFRS